MGWVPDVVSFIELELVCKIDWLKRRNGMGYGCGWNDCGCSTIYTDAYGRPINTSSSAGTVTGTCSPDWGLLAMGAVAAIAAIALAHPGKK